MRVFGGRSLKRVNRKTLSVNPFSTHFEKAIEFLKNIITKARVIQTANFRITKRTSVITIQHIGRS